MADLKISQLPGATTPLAGSEVLPIVQSSATKQVSIANLTAGRSISVADATLTTGNLVIGTFGKGIDFSATGQAEGMTSELLNDYEEGTWTPADASGGGLTLTINSATYVKIGRLVTIQMDVTYPVTLNGGVAAINGVPFTPANNNGAALYTNTINSVVGAQLTNGGILYFQTVTGGNVSPAGMSGSAIRLTCSYQA